MPIFSQTRLVRTTLLTIMGLFSLLSGTRAKDEETPAPAPAPSAAPEPADAKPEDAGRELRKKILSQTAKDLGIAPSPEFPRIYGVLVEWPLGKTTATILSMSTGAASLYTTSSYGIIGGEPHERVAGAAKAAVRAADKHFDAAKPVKEFPYPAAGRVNFYLLGFDGVRMLETDLAGIEDESSPYVHLFYQGQNVLGQLRLVAEKKDQEQGKK